mmetsp:Transcript_10357/g.27268  ORF Transcript_10357/g.27268 Transcript_10357/m.27268 type:complete len:257 (+) Transcript_10357:435-1205(+)
MHVTMCVYHVRSQKGHQKFIRRFMLLTAPKLVPGRDSEGALRSMSMEPRPWITWSCTFGCRVRELCPRGRLSPGAVLVLLPRNSRRSFARSRESSRSSFSRSRECSRAWRPLAHTSRRRASFVKWFRAGISGGLSGLGMKRASSSTGSVLSFCLSCFHAMKWPKLCVCSLGAIGFPTASTASPALSSLAKVLGVSWSSSLSLSLLLSRLEFELARGRLNTGGGWCCCWCCSCCCCSSCCCCWSGDEVEFRSEKLRR